MIFAITVSICFSGNMMAVEKTIYIDGKGTTDDHYQTLRAAMTEIHKLSSPKVTIILSTNTTEQSSVTINKNEDITIITSGNRQSINFDSSNTSFTDFRCIGVNGKLTIGGEGFPIIRATKSSNNANLRDENSKILVKVNSGGELNINNAELAYGSNVLWLSEENSVVNFNNGVLHSATDQVVNITHGTFNMNGGYICGHYKWKSGGPSLSINKIMNINSFESTLKNKVPESGQILGLIKDCYGIDSTTEATADNVNNSGGVYLYSADSKFIMTGGSISGIMCLERKRPVIEWNKDKKQFVYAGSSAGYFLTAIEAREGNVDISGGKIFGNYASHDGAALYLSYPSYGEVPGRYDMAVANISGNALIAYNNSGSNGPVRVEKATTLNLTGGKIASNTSGGGGGIRLVSSKLTMSGKAEICYNHSLTKNNEKYNGGGIGAVYQADYGDTRTIVELKGGLIHHNVAEGHGGGIAVTDKGNEGTACGIDAIFEGVEIYNNTSKDSGGGVYIGGGASINLDKNTKIYDNTAINKGGGFYLGAVEGHTGSLTTNSCEIYRNDVVSGNGGGVFTEFSPVTIKDGTKIYDHDIQGSGAAVCLGEASSYTQEGGWIYNNKSQLSGGAVAILDGECTISGGRVYDNESQSNGGGVFVNLDSKEKKVIISSGAEFSNNDAINGGAFYINGGTCEISNGNLFLNEATRKGGCMYVAGGDVTIKGGSMSRNTATEEGGGLFIDGGNLKMTQGNLTNNRSHSNGGAVYVNGGEVTFESGEISENTALNGGGLFLASGAEMTFTGGKIALNHAITEGDEGKRSNTAYQGGENGKVIEGCGGGVYLQSGKEEDITKLNIHLPDDYRVFGLFTNDAASGGDDIVSEGKYTNIILPKISELELMGFEGVDANPFWYQDYFDKDKEYHNEITGDTHYHAVLKKVQTVGRLKDVRKEPGTQYYEHRIEDEESNLNRIASYYLCLSLSFDMLDITVTANNLLGTETAMFQLIRHGIEADTKYDILLNVVNGKASRTLKNMPWGTYSIIPNNNWHWAYEPLEPLENIRVGETSFYNFEFDMHHKSGPEYPQHDERQP